MGTLTEWVTAFFLLAGATFLLIGSVALARLPDLYMRLHGPTKVTTLGVGGVLIASSIHFSRQGLSLHELLITLFLFITAPISAQLLARAARHLRVASIAPPPP